jgi:crossover junction endodeoxyribonuclease RuvC
VRILGIDPGSRVTGYGVLEVRGGDMTAVEFGAITPPSHLTFLERLPFILRSVEALLSAAMPDSVAVEDIFHAHNARVALQLGHVRGVALAPILSRGLPVQAYAPRAVKQAVTGHGGADKEQVRRMVMILLRLNDTSMPLDASDALAVAICEANSAPFRNAVQLARA